MWPFHVRRFRGNRASLQKSPQNASHALTLIVDSGLWVASMRWHSRPQLDRSSRWAELWERARKCVATKEHILYQWSLTAALQQRDLYHSVDVIIVHPHPQLPPTPPVPGPRHRPVLLQLSCSRPVKWRKLRNFGWWHKSGDGLFTYKY